MEALVLYTMTELFTSKEIDTGMRLLVATIFQIGVNMGCHRDGSHFPNISAFESEMRRRVWAVIIKMSVQLRVSFPFLSNKRGSQINSQLVYSHFFVTTTDNDCRDLGVSKLVGLPRVVRHDQTDVAEPSNLFDSDFDEDSS